MDRESRRTGIGVLGNVPWGTHCCLFCETKDDLREALVPHFKAGMEGKEFCVWADSEPLTEREAAAALRGGVPAFDQYLADGSDEILSGSAWHFKGGRFDLQRISDGWQKRLHGVLAKGHAAMRVSGNAFRLAIEHWKSFCDDERDLNEPVVRRPMTVLRTYPLGGINAAEALEVTCTHQAGIARRRAGWEVVETAELKQSKRKIKRLNEEIERRVAERTKQLTAANEELRAQIAQHERAEEARAAIDRTVSYANLAGDVIKRIRALLSRNQPEQVDLDLNDAVNEVLALTYSELNRRHISVATDPPAGLPRIRGDRVQLQQVMLNLILNGLEAISAATDRPRVINIGSRVTDAGTVLVTVEDSGVELDPATADRLFEPSSTTKPDGMAMSLAVSRSIIEADGGRLWASPGAHHGAVFQFTLPHAADGAP